MASAESGVETNEEHTRVFGEYVQALALTLQPHAPNLVTPRTIISARLAVSHVTYAEGWHVQIIEALTQDEQTRQQARTKQFEITHSILPRLRPALERIDADLEREGTSHATWLAHPQGGKLNEQAMAAWQRGNLTIGELFKLQPMAVIGTSS